VDVHGLADGQREVEPVEDAARDGRVQDGAFLRVFEGHEDVRPGVVAAELGHLAFHPDSR